MATLKQRLIQRLISPEIRILVDKLENNEIWKQAVIGHLNSNSENDYMKARKIADVYDTVVKSRVFTTVEKWYFSRAVNRAKIEATKASILRAVLDAEEQPELITKDKGKIMSSMAQSLNQAFAKEYARRSQP